MTRSLDRCGTCNVGRFITYTTKSEGSRKLRYLKCNFCGTTAKEVCNVDAVGRVLYTNISNPVEHNAASQAYSM
jgi:formate dehydrogenase maturation protein FdhE